MAIQTFNCFGTSTSLPAVPRAYWCCGWDNPPASFSGVYSCSATGGIAATQCAPTKVDEPITLSIYDYCEFLPGYFLYQTGATELIYAYVSKQFCTLADGSDTVPFQLYLAAPYPKNEVFSCSYINGVHSFFYSSNSTITYSDSSILTMSIALDTVTM